MAREDWTRDPRRDDYGQADYSTDYAYDPVRRAGYRPEDDPALDPRAGLGYSRAAPPEHRAFDRQEPVAPRRRGPSDRVLWAVVVERLEDERGVDMRDVEVSVVNGEVILDGTVRRKADKRRIEDVADIDGVINVQNNLRVRDRAWGLF